MAREPKTSGSDVIRLLENLTVADREKVIAAAGQQRDARRESGTRELIEEFRARAGRPPGRARAARKGAPAASPAAKYRNPETGETWSGRGQVPRWLKRAGEQGRGREEFAVKR